MIQHRKCKSTLNTPAEYTGQLTERALRDRFGEHRRAIKKKNCTSAFQSNGQPRSQGSLLGENPGNEVVKRTQTYRHRSYPT